MKTLENSTEQIKIVYFLLFKFLDMIFLQINKILRKLKINIVIKIITKSFQ
jgi:hypothetical protein